MSSIGRFGLAAIVSATLLACGAEEATPDRPGARRIVYLDFADGVEGVAHGEDDDAPRNVSRLCAAPAFARWTAPEACEGGDDSACREKILEHVAAYFAPYDVALTLSRPGGGTFSTILIAPPHAACAFGQRGVAFTDCEDANPASLGFVFDCYDDAASCAVLVAHEVGHGFGLVHSDDPTDIMTSAPGDPALAFRHEESKTPENTCARLSQSSHLTLLELLGPRVAEPR